MNAGQRNAEDGAVDLHGVRQGIGPEQYPGKAGETEGDKDPEHFVSLVLIGNVKQGEKLFPGRLKQVGKDLVKSVEKAPCHKGEGGAVPKAADGEHNHNIESVPPFGTAAAPKGKVKVILKPAGQGNVPAPPEVLDGYGKVGTVEVLHQVKAQHFCGAPCNVGIGGEVTVNLKGKGGSGNQELRPSVLFGRVVNLVDDDGQVVGDHDLFEKPPQSGKNPLFDVVETEGVVFLELVQDIPGTLNGSGDKLGEKGDKQRVINKAFFSFNIFPVHVDGIAERLEGIEGDAYRKKHIQERDVHLESGEGKGPGDHVGSEIVVFKEKQDGKVQQEAENQPEPPFAPHGALHKQAAKIGDGGRKQHEQSVFGIPAHVEIIACCKQLEIPESAGKQIIDDNIQHQEDEVGKRIEIQTKPPFRVICVNRLTMGYPPRR